MSELLALEGIKILDLSRLGPGPFCTMILGDLGAEVIKIEASLTAGTREGGLGASGIKEAYKAFDRNKKSIALNLKSEKGRHIFCRLAEGADVIVEGFRPGVVKRLGIDYQTIAKINPGIIYCSITGYGQDGPYYDFKASDLISAAAGGQVYFQGDTDRPPVRMTAEQAYCHAGSQAAVASLMALYHRQATGNGQQIDVSIQECMAWPTTYPIPWWDCLRQNWPRAGGYQKRAGLTRKLLFPCKDGVVQYRIGLALLGARSSRNMTKTMNEEGLGLELKDIDWASIGVEDVTQEQHDRWVIPIQEYFMRHTRKELFEASVKNNFMLGPVNTPQDVCEDEQLAARNFWINVEHPELGESIAYPGAFYKSNETKWQIKRRAPLIGEHNIEIFEGELGFTRQEIVTLKEAGII